MAPGKRAFIPHEGNIGGAHMILSDYINLHGRAASAKPDQDILAVRHAATQSASPSRIPCTQGAARLSQNRQARLANTDRTAAEHVHNVYHLTRRIEEMYLASARKKNEHDPTAHPVYLRRGAPGSSPQSPTHRPGLHQALIDPWLRGEGYNVLQPGALEFRRPASAPHHQPPPSPTRHRQRNGRDGYSGWSIGPSLRVVFPSDDFPLRRRPPINLTTEYAIYKQAIMSEIVQNRMYRELTLRRLFHKYIKLAPLADKDTVQHVVADLKAELGVA